MSRKSKKEEDLVLEISTPKLMDKRAKAKNTVNILHPYRTSFGTWVYDDPDIGVYSEAFVCGSSEVIDHLVGEDNNFFDLVISAHPLPGYQAKIVKIQKEEEPTIEGWYHLEGTEMDHWLCGEVLSYFEGYPDEIYIRVENCRKEK